MAELVQVCKAMANNLALKEIAAVVTYERNAWGNNTGDAVQACDVKAADGGQGSIRHTAAPSAAAVVDTVSAAVSDVVEATQVAEEVEEDLTKVYTLDEMMAMGEDVYNTSCTACHQPTGKGIPPAFPSLVGSPITTGDVSAHIDMVLNGSAKNPAMAAFASQLTKTQIAAVVTFERNAWGNNTGDLIQAADVAAISAK